VTDPSPRLLVSDSGGQRIVPIDKPIVTLGRRSETDVRIAVAGVSRLHAALHHGHSLTR
jgi:pSer/pThr/pTyr-binding forkhead associated (FHA) protein